MPSESVAALMVLAGAVPPIAWVVHNIVIARMALRGSKPAEREKILSGLAKLRPFNPSGPVSPQEAAGDAPERVVTRP